MAAGWCRLSPVIRKASSAAMCVALAVPTATVPAPDCYDVKIRARAVDQIPSDIPDCGSDCIIMQWPWFIDLRVTRVLDGAIPDKIVRVLALEHTYYVKRERTWFLRKNGAGGYNVLTPEEGQRLNQCSADASPVKAYIDVASAQRLDEFREEGIRRYGHHKN